MAAILQAPAALRPGDRVHVIAPSGSFDLARLEAGLDILREAGLEPVWRPLGAAERYLAAADGARLAQLEAALSDPDCRCIWAARGGYGAARLLPQLASSQVRAANRWLVGYSDITALHALWAQAGLMSVHAANLLGLADWEAAERQQIFTWLLARPAPAPSWPVQVLRAGASSVVDGRLWGGNLAVMTSLVGTGRLPTSVGSLLFLEEVDEAPYRLDRMLTQLHQAGVLTGVRAVLLGQLTRCAYADGDDGPRGSALAAILAALPTTLPVVAGLPIGHETASAPLLLGAEARLDFAAARLSLAAPG